MKHVGRGELGPGESRVEGCITGVDDEAVRAELERVLRSSTFAGSERHRRFLAYIVDETLAGRADRLKAYNIATTAFHRGADFDPQLDSIVRIEAGRLRRALEHYYLTEGRDRDVEIVVPKGSYVPQFVHVGDQAPPDVADPPREAAAGLRRRAPRLFVMPFEQEGESDEVPWLARSLVRQVIVGLTRFSSVYVYGAETTDLMHDRLRADGQHERLGIDLVLSGTVSLRGESLIVDLLLQETGSLRFLWSEQFIRRFAPESIRDIRDEVATSVAQKLAQPYGVLFDWALDDEGRSPENLEGYRAVVDFYQYVRTFQTHELNPVRNRLEKAIAQDPSFAEGHACLAQLYCQFARFFTRDRDELARYSDLGFSHARKALLLAPRSSNCHHALALAYWFSGLTTPAIESFRTAISLNPNDPDLMADLGLRYCLLMDWERGIPLSEEAYRRNPGQPNAYRMAFVLYHFAHGRYAEALQHAQRLDSPGVVYHHLAAAACAVRLGLHQVAHDAVARIERIEPDYAQRVASDLASRNVHPKLAEDLVEALREAGLGGDGPPADARKVSSPDQRQAPVRLM